MKKTAEGGQTYVPPIHMNQTKKQNGKKSEEPSQRQQQPSKK
jgi:hypothetical protein